MRVNEVYGHLLECTDPAYVRGVHVAWVSSPGDRAILGTGRGDTPAAACHAAIEDALSLPHERMSSGRERALKTLRADLIQRPKKRR